LEEIVSIWEVIGPHFPQERDLTTTNLTMDYFRGAKSVYVALLPIVGGKIEV
jgi:hypothetical protein